MPLELSLVLVSDRIRRVSYPLVELLAIDISLALAIYVHAP